ncbi:uncharacterized protein METZ01_LOCUS393251, partial [marine metagenome]
MLNSRFIWSIYGLLFLFHAELTAQVPYQRLVDAQGDLANWLTYSGTYNGHRFSPLDEINNETVENLVPKWVYQVKNPGIVETTPLVVDGVMYLTEPPSNVTALDAET